MLWLCCLGFCLARNEPTPGETVCQEKEWHTLYSRALMDFILDCRVRAIIDRIGKFPYKHGSYGNLKEKHVRKNKDMKSLPRSRITDQLCSIEKRDTAIPEISVIQYPWWGSVAYSCALAVMDCRVWSTTDGSWRKK